MKDILNIYKERLVDISSRNRSFNCSKLTGKNGFDLTRLNITDNSLADKILKYLLSSKTEEQITILEDISVLKSIKETEINEKFSESNEEKEKALEHLAKIVDALFQCDASLTKLYKEHQFVLKETGKHELFIGYPFVEGNLKDKTFFKAPLFLFPVNLTFEKGRIFLKKANSNVLLNKVLLLGISKHNEVEIDLNELITEFEVIKKDDIENILIKLIDFGVVVKERPTKIESFKSYTVETRPKYEIGQSVLKSNLVLGRFPIANSIYNDYQELINKNISSGTLYQLLGHSRETDNLSSNDYDKTNFDEHGKLTFSEKDLYCISNLDYSQELAVRKASTTDSLVIYGPPGTGKSQTLTNIISDALSKNQKVLMVSQKKAALEVIYNRLGTLQSKSVLIYEATKDKKSFYNSVSNHVLEAQTFSQTVTLDDLNRISECVDSDLMRLESLGEVLHRPNPFGLTLQQMYSKSKEIENISDPRFTEFVRFKKSNLFENKNYLQIKELIESISDYQLQAFFEFKKLLNENPYLEQIDLSLSSFELLENDYLLNELKQSSKPFFKLLSENNDSIIFLLNEVTPIALTLSNEAILKAAQKLNSKKNIELLEPLNLDRWAEYSYWDKAESIELLEALKNDSFLSNHFLKLTDSITNENVEIAKRNVEELLYEYKQFSQKISNKIDKDFLNYISNVSTSNVDLHELDIAKLVKSFNDSTNGFLLETMTSSNWKNCYFWTDLGLSEKIDCYSTEILGSEIENLELKDLQQMHENLSNLKNHYEELFVETQCDTYLYQTFINHWFNSERTLSENDLIKLASSINSSLNSHLIKSMSFDNWKSSDIWVDLGLIEELSNYDDIIPYPKEILEYDLAIDILESYSPSYLDFSKKKVSLGDTFDFVRELFKQHGFNLSKEVVSKSLVQYLQGYNEFLNRQITNDSEKKESFLKFTRKDLENFLTTTNHPSYFEKLKEFKVVYKELQKSINPNHLNFIMKAIDEKSSTLDEINFEALLNDYYNLLYQDEINYVNSLNPYALKNLVHFFSIKREIVAKKDYLLNEKAALHNQLEQHLMLLKTFFTELDSLKKSGAPITILTRLKTEFIKNKNLIPFIDSELILTELYIELKKQDSSKLLTYETLILHLFNTFILNAINMLNELDIFSKNGEKELQSNFLDSQDISSVIRNEIELLELIVTVKELSSEKTSDFAALASTMLSDIEVYFHLFLEQTQALKLIVKDSYLLDFKALKQDSITDFNLSDAIGNEITFYQHLTSANKKEIVDFKEYKEIEFYSLKEGETSFELIREQLNFIEAISKYTQFLQIDELKTKLINDDSLESSLEKEIEFATLMELGFKTIEDDLEMYEELEFSILDELNSLNDLVTQIAYIGYQTEENSVTDLKTKIIDHLKFGSNAVNTIESELELIDLLIQGKNQEIKNLDRYKEIETNLTNSLELVIEETFNQLSYISCLNDRTPLLNIENLTHHLFDSRTLFKQIDSFQKFISLLCKGVHQVSLNEQEYQKLENLIYFKMEELRPQLEHQLALLKKAETLFTNINLLDLLKDCSVFDSVVDEHVKAYDLFKLNHDVFKTVSDLSDDMLEIFNYTYHEELSIMKQRIENLLEFSILREIHEMDKIDIDQKALLVSNDFNSIVCNINKNLLRKQSLSKTFLINKWSENFNSNSSRQSTEFVRQANKKRQLWSIRRYVEEFPDLILNLYPCFLLSPEMVSQVLPLTEGLFDLVIFDESSQMFVENAIPSIYRGKKVIIAGDDKQLKPNKTFRAMCDNDCDNEDIAELDEESLLDLAKIKYPSVSLNYHYRSKYSELINFSNYAFYNGRLKISPNLNDFDSTNPPIERLMVEGHWIDNKNMEEAEAVVSKVYELLKSRENNETIGVITFNSYQRELIIDLLDQRAQNDLDFRNLYTNEINRIDNDEDVSLFVKNIENVQGDERDIIIFSIGYAPNEYGKISVNFGPLSNVGGENRLNVAISRAKEKIILVTSIEPELLSVERTTHLGPKLFKKYLQYARNISEGRLEDAEIILKSVLDTPLTENNDYCYDSDFEMQVCEALKKEGFIVKTQIGVAGYYIDLAIYDPIQSKYILGIECDGATYHSSKSARERDIHRQRYLESRGWQITRIWSRDWWKNPSKEITKIVKLIKNKPKNNK